MDLISNTLTIIRNANFSKKESLVLPHLPKIQQLTYVLKQEGFIHSFYLLPESQILVKLKYNGKRKKPILTNLKRISKPGRRVYINHREIPNLFGGIGILLISTSRGLITNKQAQKWKIGGELICSIW